MKRFFMKDTEDELQFGDQIVLDLTKETKNGNTIHQHLNCKFIPELVEMLLENDIIDVVDDDHIIHFADEDDDYEEDDDEEEGCDLLDEFMNRQYVQNRKLQDQITKLQGEVKELKDALTSLVKSSAKKDARKQESK